MNNKVLLSYAIRERLLAVSHETAFPKGTNAEPPEFVPVEHSLSALYAAVEKHRPRAVLWELFPDDAGAVTVIRTARRRWGVQCPSFIILGEFVSKPLERELYEAGADFVVTGEFDALRIYRMLCPDRTDRVPLGLRENRREADGSGKPLERMVTDILHQLGVPAHIKGYHYLRFSIMEAVLKPVVLEGLTGLLYPQVAEMYFTTPARVERSIRHAVELSWDRGNIDTLQDYFGSTVLMSRGKPTNGEFIAMIADRIRVEIRSAS